MKRNKFAVSKGDKLFGGVFTVAQLRKQYTANGGPLNNRRKRFLRTFIPPYSNGSGLQTEFALLIPLSKILEKAPQDVKNRMRSHFELADADWFAARSWIGDSANYVDPTQIDNELGTELTNGWNAGWGDPQ